jgi:hypothetical protein
VRQPGRLYRSGEGTEQPDPERESEIMPASEMSVFVTASFPVDKINGVPIIIFRTFAPFPNLAI